MTDSSPLARARAGWRSAATGAPGVPALTLHLRQLAWLRTFAIAGQVLMILGVHYGLGMPLWLPADFLVIGLYALTGAGLWLAALRGRPATTPVLLRALLVDVVALTAILALNGGYTNPFAFFYLLPLAIGAALLPPVPLTILAGACLAGYSALAVIYQPLPRYEGLFGNNYTLHLLGMWGGFAIAVAAVAIFVGFMAHTARRSQRALAAARERALKDQQVAALGALAAGSAHELGTPLSTMQTLVAELLREETDADKRRDLALLRDQVLRCRDSLRRATASAGEARPEQAGPQRLDRYLDELIARCRADCPDARLHCALPSHPAPAVLVHDALTQSLLSLIVNAVEAGGESPVHLQAEWTARDWTLRIVDSGPGIEPRYRTPRLWSSSKGHGRGLGLFLAEYVIGAAGGELRLEPGTRGGTCVTVTLPRDLDTRRPAWDQPRPAGPVEPAGPVTGSAA